MKPSSVLLSHSFSSLIHICPRKQFVEYHNLKTKDTSKPTVLGQLLSGDGDLALLPGTLDAQPLLKPTLPILNSQLAFVTKLLEV